MAINFTDQTAYEAIQSGQPVVIDFWATWCGPCKALTPVIEKLADEYQGRVVIGKYNVDEESELAGENRIMSVPTILFYKNGQKTSIRMTGNQGEALLRQRIDDLLAL